MKSIQYLSFSASHFIERDGVRSKVKSSNLFFFKLRFMTTVVVYATIT